MKTKSILDVIRESICPDCKQVMWWNPPGTSWSIDAGNLCGRDGGDYWSCSCGYDSEEETK